jgi:hypothetical protein
LICRSCANPTARHPSRVRLGRHLSPSSLSLLHRQRPRSSQSRHDPTGTHNRKCAENPKHVTKSKIEPRKHYVIDIRHQQSPSATSSYLYYLPFMDLNQAISAYFHTDHRSSPIARRPSLLRNHLRANCISMRYLTDSRSEALLLGSHGHCTRPPLLLLSIASRSSSFVLVTPINLHQSSPSSPGLGAEAELDRVTYSTFRLRLRSPFYPPPPPSPRRRGLPSVSFVVETDEPRFT